MSLKAKIEAVIYASEEPVTLAQLTGLLGEEAQAELDARDSQQQMLALDENAIEETSEGAETPPGEAPAARESAPDSKARERGLRDHFRSVVDELVADYADAGRGLEIREVAGGYRLATKPEYHDAVRGFVKSLKPPMKLTLQALETLAVVAYKQPVTAPEVSEIRGVDSGAALGGLMTRKLVTTAGRKQVIGRPILYRTTKDFLLRFGLKDISELPSIEEFEKMAGELADADPVQEEIPMEPEHYELSKRMEQAKDEVSSQADGLGVTVENNDDYVSTPEGDSEQPDSKPVSPAHGEMARPRGDGPHTGQPFNDVDADAAR